MKLKVIGQEELKIYAFGSFGPTIEKGNKVELFLETPLRRYNVKITASKIQNRSGAIINSSERVIKRVLC